MAEEIIRFFKYGSLIFAILFTLIIVWGSLDKGGPPTGDFRAPQYNLHFISYLVLTFVWYVHFLIVRSKMPFAYSMSLAITVGILLEIVQSFIPYRYFDLIDITMNILGSGLILILLPFYKKIDHLVKILYEKFS